MIVGHIALSCFDLIRFMYTYIKKYTRIFERNFPS